MKQHTQLIIVSIIALMLGLIIAQPLFNSNINKIPSPDSNEHVCLDVDVVYAYFSTQPVSENIPGILQSNHSYYTTGSLFVVLNVTNHSNIALVMSTFHVFAAQEISIDNGSNGSYGRHARLPLCNFQQSYFPENFLLYTVDDMTWQPYESRLVALSGFTQFHNCNVLQNGTFYIGGEVKAGIPYGYSSYYSGVGAKLISVKAFGNEYFYNELVAENETLQLSPSGLTVEIISKR
jgi:hypothetical protein